MKRILIAALAVAACNGPTFDYAPSVIIRKNWSNDAWENSSKDVYEYDEEGRIEQVFTYDWAGGAWEQESRRRHEYDEAGLLTRAVRASREGDAWTDNSRTTYEYDKEGRLEVAAWYRLEQREGSEPQWKKDSRDAYDWEDGRLVARTLSYAENDEWVAHDRWTWEYDRDGHLTGSSLWSKEGADWKKSSVDEYSFDDEGLLLEEVHKIRKGEEFEQSAKLTYASTDGLLSEVLQSLYEGGAWEKSDRAVLEVEPGSSAVATIERYRGGVWEKRSLYEVEMTEEGNSDILENAWHPKPVLEDEMMFMYGAAPRLRSR